MMKSTDELSNEFIRTFTEMVKDLWIMSETDALMTPFIWKKNAKLDDAFLLKKSKLSLNSVIEKWTLEDFFKNKMRQQDWHSAEEALIAKRFAELQKSLQEKLSEISVYKIGEAKKQVFIVGKLNDKLYAGLSTYVVET